MQNFEPTDNAIIVSDIASISKVVNYLSAGLTNKRSCLSVKSFLVHKDALENV